MIDVLEKKPVWRTVWFAVLLCGVLLGLSLAPGTSDWIELNDQRAALWFNDLAGASPVFDRIVLLVADDDEGTEGLVALAAVWFLSTLWLAPTRVAKARLLGTFFFIVAVLVPYFMLDSILDDVIERKSPSMEFLKPFNDLGKLLDYNVDLTDKRSFPNIDAMIMFTIGFLLLRLGRRHGGIVALGLGATVPVLLCVAGLAWVSDIFLGSLPLSILVSAIALETPFARLFEGLVDASAAGIDEGERMLRNFYPIWRHRRLYWLSQKASHMEVAVKRFTRRDIPTILDKKGRYAAEVPSLTVPLGGLRSVIRIVSMGPLKAVIRAYPLNQRGDAEQHFRASTLLAQHEVRVPEIYHRTDSPKDYGALFIVEEFIEGCSKKPSQITPDEFVAAAKELARLHQLTSQTWGPVDQPRTEDFANVLLRRLERQVGQLVRGSISGVDQASVGLVRRWFQNWQQDLFAVTNFSLIHGKLHRDNCMFETGGGFCLLDVTTLEWGIPAVDLVQVHHSLCGDRPELIAQFDAAYYNETSETEAAKRLHFVALFEAMYCVGQISKHRKRMARGFKSGKGVGVAKSALWWRRLMDIVRAQ